MPRTSESSVNPWRWTVLTLLHERPMHPYEIRGLTTSRGKDLLVEHKPGSLYSVIDVLYREGLVEQEAVTRVGRLPERTVYRITERGRAALMDWLHSALAEPSARDVPRFAFAVEKLAHLTPSAATALLRRRSAALEEQLASLEGLVADADGRGVPRSSLLEVDYACAIRKAELVWLRGVLGELASGRLHWEPADGVRDAGSGTPERVTTETSGRTVHG